MSEPEARHRLAAILAADAAAIRAQWRRTIAPHSLRWRSRGSYSQADAAAISETDARARSWTGSSSWCHSLRFSILTGGAAAHGRRDASAAGPHVVRAPAATEP